METNKLEIQSLIESVMELKKIPNEKFIENLESRKMKELEFHNRDRDEAFVKEAQESSDTFEKFYGNKKYYKTTALSKNYVDEWIEKNANDKVCLDFACGNGENSFKMLLANASLVLGMDISDISIDNCNRELEVSHPKQMSKAIFFQGDCENTLLPDNSIDTVICSGMLHHLDLQFAYPELQRILKPGGKLLAIEALDYNPAIKLYRWITPDMRTDWEKAHILSMKDVRFAKKYFKVGEIKFWHITSYVAGKFPMLLRPLNILDSLLTKIPGIRLMAWIFTFELIKKD
ncbi:class I SAM-dependent methyltransferase [Gammaproteobacteria bacterium]|nr:class I SAM-dependent methyltransferase [Gammaproteobacteria bacterium]